METPRKLDFVLKSASHGILVYYGRGEYDFRDLGPRLARVVTITSEAISIQTC